MSFIKRGKWTIISCIVVAIIASTITAYATGAFTAGEIDYTRTGSSVENVEQALNELYGYIASGADYEIITNKVVAGADINNTYICEYIPQFFFITVDRSDGGFNWIYATNNCSNIMLWSSFNSSAPYLANSYFVVNSNGVKFYNWGTSVNYTLNIWIIK